MKSRKEQDERKKVADEKVKKAVPGGGPQPRWEYKVIKADGTPEALEAELNKLGEDGWDVVATHTQMTTGRGFAPPSPTAYYTLKRQKK